MKTVDWIKTKPILFTAHDKISDKLIDAFHQSKEVMRDMKECSITDATAKDNEACVKAKQYYNNMLSTIPKIKATIDEVEKDENTTADRKNKALEVKARIAKIEETSMETPSGTPESGAIQNVYNFCLFILASVLLY